MKRILILLLVVITVLAGCKHRDQQNLARPKLVVGIVIDQMRWDYLYRYYSRYSEGGFKRLLNNGFSCENTMLPYLPSYTGPGHTCIYTGSVPSIHGIAANNWIDNITGEAMYCVDDNTVHLTGDTTNAPSMSPRTLLTTTITDELRLATNLKSRTYGIALKDRGSILPAGHLANAAYWYNDKTGTFTTSTYYPNQNPAWLQSFNKRKVGDSLTKLNWKLLYDANSYTQSTTDANNYEKPFKSEKTPVFPHVFDTLADTNRYAVIKSIPAGNAYTLQMARACMQGENLGNGEATDFLAISLSSPDYAGHQFGPNSIEIEDMYLRLDKEIADYLNYLDAKVGKGNYLLFLSADHGAAHNTTYLSDLDVPSGIFKTNMVLDDMNAYLKGKFGKDSLIANALNYQLYLNNKLMTTANIDRDKVKGAITEWLNRRPEVGYVIDMENIDKTPVPEPIRSMVVNGYNKIRSGSIWIIPNPGWYEGAGNATTGTTHGTWQPYDTHIPLLWYGWHVKKGVSHKTVYMTDISATLAAFLHIQMPNGCIGHVITDVIE
ncbi:MAG: alkaline phosphatase family protein [Flavipsychrobacter sp.]|nr:alkaline phosphatase family protein [Flavipsychrobacter sp.]